MSELINKLQPGSFRGVPFLIKETMSVDFGRKIVLNEIPDSDRRTIQDLGLFNRNFSLSVLINEASGVDYFQARDALIDAMETPGEGILVHPSFGSITVHPSTASFSENLRDFGNGQFELSFSVSQKQISPVDTGDAASRLDVSGDISNSNLQTSLGGLFNISPRFSGNTLDSIEQLSGFVAVGRDAIKQIGLSVDQLSAANGALNLFNLGKVALVADSLALAESTRNLFDELLNLGLEAAANIALMGTFFDFGDRDALLNPNNRQIVERNRNRAVFSQTVQAHALAQSYRAVGLIDFSNSVALNDTRVVLDNQFEKIVLDSVLTGDATNALEDTRVTTSLFFSQQSIATFNLVDFNTPSLPITILTYNLYNSTDNDANLIALNDIKDVGFVRGQLEILGA